MKEWVAASHMILEANPNYWKGKPKLDQINIRFVPDAESQLAAISAGDADLSAMMSASDKPPASPSSISSCRIRLSPSIFSNG